jgi:hypothetical protein
MPFFVSSQNNEPVLNVLPKTGQTASYFTGDDGDLEKGWNNGTRFNTLTLNGKTIIQDQATGLMWPGVWTQLTAVTDNVRYKQLATCRTTGIGDVNTAAYGGYNDWRIPNIHELFSILDFSQTSYTNRRLVSVFTIPFANPCLREGLWSSTSDANDPTAVYVLHGNYSPNPLIATAAVSTYWASLLPCRG